MAYVTLNRPRVLNVYNMQMRDELYQVLQAVRDDPHVQGAVLTGAGDRAFCAGADLTEFGTAPSQAIARQVRWERDVWGLFCDIDKPLVAALLGYVLGSGIEMAALCDFRVASEEAVFGMPETALGMIPAAGGTQTLPRLLGPSRSLDLLLTARRFSAQEALEMGFLTRVVPRHRLLDAAQALLATVLGGDIEAVRAAKRVVNEGMDMPLAEALALERHVAQWLLTKRAGHRSTGKTDMRQQGVGENCATPA